jgi:predicted Zn-dependent protease
MPLYHSAGNRICVYILVVIAVCLPCTAQSSDRRVPKPDDARFKDLLEQGFELHRQARFAEALPVLERARELQPRDYFVNLLLGIDLLRTGRKNEAVSRLELAARTKPDEDTPEEYLGEAQAALGHYAPATEAYRQAMLRAPNSEEALEAWAGFALERFRQIGESLRSSEAGVGTVRRLQETAANPTSSLACHQPIPALERELAAPHAVPEHLDIAYRLSICYAVEAGKAAAQLQSNAKDQGAVHRLRGDVLLRIKTDAAAAEAEYRNAISLRPGDPALLARLAEAQLAAGDTEGAARSAQAALAIDPHRTDALHTLAFLAMSSRDYDQALPWLRQLVAESPGDRSAQVELGRALAQTGNNTEALQYLAPALDAGYPDEKGALHALEARVFRDLGRDAEAAKASAEARRLSDAFQARNKTGAEAKRDAVQ